MRASRKDDMEMLCCLLIYLSNYYMLPELSYPNSTIYNNEHRLFFLQSYKNSYTLDKMCQYIRNKDTELCQFSHEVQKLKFKSEPNYEKLRQILKGLINYEKQKNFQKKTMGYCSSSDSFDYVTQCNTRSSGSEENSDDTAKDE